VAVDDAEPWCVDRVLRDQPGESAAEADVRVVGCEQRCEGPLGRWKEHVGAFGRRDQVFGLPGRPRHDHSGNVMPERACARREPLRDENVLREDDDAHARR